MSRTGEGNYKLRSAAGARLDPRSAAVAFRHLACDSEPRAGSLHISSYRPLKQHENPLRVPSRHSGTSILHHDAGAGGFRSGDLIRSDLNIRRDSNSTRWLTDIIWAAAARLGYEAHFLSEQTTIDDDHMPFMRSGVPSVDIIDLDYPAWHTADDDLDHVSARSLQVVGDVVLEALPQIEKRLASAP